MLCLHHGGRWKRVFRVLCSFNVAAEPQGKTGVAVRPQHQIWVSLDAQQLIVLGCVRQTSTSNQNTHLDAL